jgi:flavin-binding protein dodecin
MLLVAAFATPEVVADEVCQVTFPDGTVRSVACCKVFEDSCPHKEVVVTGSSNTSWEEAAKKAIAAVSESSNIDSAKLIGQELDIGGGGPINAYRAKVKVSFKYEAE